MCVRNSELYIDLISSIQSRIQQANNQAKILKCCAKINELVGTHVFYREAIYYEDDVPGAWKEYTAANEEFFVELGSPGGAAKVGLTPTDHPLVKAAPPAQSNE